MSGAYLLPEEALLGVFKIPICSLQLANTEEYINGELAGNLGEVLIRLAGDIAAINICSSPAWCS